MEPRDIRPERPDNGIMSDEQFAALLRRIALGQVPEHVRILFANFLRGTDQQPGGQPGAAATQRHDLPDDLTAFSPFSLPIRASEDRHPWLPEDAGAHEAYLPREMNRAPADTSRRTEAPPFTPRHGSDNPAGLLPRLNAPTGSTVVP